MSIIDEFDFNNKFHFVLMETMDIDQMERQEKSLNRSVALSHRQLLSLLKLFKVSPEDAAAKFNAFQDVWAVFQPVAVRRDSGEYIRDQISLLINVGQDRTSRIYIRPMRAVRDEVLPILAAVRNPQQLFELLGDLDDASITRRPRRRGGHGKPGTVTQGKFRSEHKGASHRPFEGLKQVVNAS